MRVEWLEACPATVEDFERIMAVNVQGVMLCFKHAAQEMAKQGRGGRLIGTQT